MDPIYLILLIVFNAVIWGTRYRLLDFNDARDGIERTPSDRSRVAAIGPLLMTATSVVVVGVLFLRS